MGTNYYHSYFTHIHSHYWYTYRTKIVHKKSFSFIEYNAQSTRFRTIYYRDIVFYKMGACYYDPEVGRFTQPEPAWSNPMFNSMGGRNLLTERVFATAATMGQELIPMPQGIYLPASDYNWYSYACSDPVNNSDIAGYWNWKKFTGGLTLMAIGIGSVLLGLVTISCGLVEIASIPYTGGASIETGLHLIVDVGCGLILGGSILAVTGSLISWHAIYE